jgi:hypothetical protein
VKTSPAWLEAGWLISISTASRQNVNRAIALSPPQHPKQPTSTFDPWGSMLTGQAFHQTNVIHRILSQT